MYEDVFLGIEVVSPAVLVIEVEGHGINGAAGVHECAKIGVVGVHFRFKLAGSRAKDVVS